LNFFKYLITEKSELKLCMRTFIGLRALKLLFILDW